MSGEIPRSNVLGPRPTRWPVLRTTWKGFLADDCVDLAAQMSFYFVMSIFPFLLVIAAIIGWLPFTNAWHTFAEWIVRFFPAESRQTLFSVILDLTNGYKSFLSLGILGILWGASSGFVSLMESLSVAHGVRETRGFWKKRGIAVAATIGAAIFFIISFGILTAGSWAKSLIGAPLQHYAWMHAISLIVRWVATLLLMCIGMDLVDHFLPNMKRRWRWFSLSNLIISLTFIAATVGFNFYVRHTSSFSQLYGAIAGFIIFLFWVYIACLILLIGAEVEKAVRMVRDQCQKAAA